MSSRKSRYDLNDDQVQELYLYHLESKTNGKLGRYTVQNVADKFGVHVWTVVSMIPKAKSCKDFKSIIN